MNRKQRAMEERFRRPPRGKETFPAKERYSLDKPCSEAERMKAEWIEQNRECTVEDVLELASEHLSYDMWITGGIAMSYQPPPKWKSAARDIIRSVKDSVKVEFTGTISTTRRGMWGWDYTEEFVRFFKIKAVEEFHKRNTPLYKLL